MKYRLPHKQLGLMFATLVSISGLVTAPVYATSLPETTLASSTISAQILAGDQGDDARLKLIISRGDNEIDRRLRKLNTLGSKISSAQKLSTADKNSLSAQVNTEISGLTDLRAQLDAETNLASAKTDAQSIFTEYRVYALVVPKVILIRAADAQLVAEDKLTQLAAKLQANIDAAKTSGKDVAALQALIDDLNSKNASAQALSGNVEASVINLQPTDYNNDHTILGGKRDQLKSAQTNIVTAMNDAKELVANLAKS